MQGVLSTLTRAGADRSHRPALSAISTLNKKTLRAHIQEAEIMDFT